MSNNLISCWGSASIFEEEPEKCEVRKNQLSGKWRLMQY